MANDLPDWTRAMTLVNTGGFVGLEEHAARLGSIVPADLQGNVILMEDFEYDLNNWVTSASGGCSVTRDNTYYKSKGYSMKLSVANGEDNNVEASYKMHLPNLGKYGFAFMWAPGKCDADFRAVCNPHTTTVSYFAEVKYNRYSGDISILRDDAVWQLVGETIRWEYVASRFIPVILKFDMETFKYISLFMGYLDYDLSDYNLATSGGGSPTLMNVNFHLTDIGNDGGDQWVDNVVVVKNLP